MSQGLEQTSSCITFSPNTACPSGERSKLSDLDMILLNVSDFSGILKGITCQTLSISWDVIGHCGSNLSPRKQSWRHHPFLRQLIHIRQTAILNTRLDCNAGVLKKLTSTFLNQDNVTNSLQRASCREVSRRGHERVGTPRGQAGHRSCTTN